MKSALAVIAMMVFASGVAASCGSSDARTVAGSLLDAGADRTTTCGGAGEPCCNGAACDNGFACSAGTCSPGEAVDDAAVVDAPADVAFADAPADASGDVVLAEASDAVADAAAEASGGSCHGGEYKGSLTGTYSSSLELGIPIPVTGQVDVTLDPAGRVQSGTIEGVSDTISGHDAGFAGPFFCTLAGALDCATGAFGGWAQCTYCIGPVADGGLGCSLTAGGGTTGIGGHYAGPMTATYDPGTNAFVMGTWNAAEALAGNDGGSPGPDGGPPSNYLSDSGVYLGPGNYGGSGTWSATHQ